MAVSVELTRSEDELKQRFESLSTPEDVADLLEIPYDHLNYILFWGRHFFPYHKFPVRKKSGGFREINAPPKSLRILQSKLNTVRCAVSIQQELKELKIGGTETPIRVRMGLHTGEPVKHQEDFFGYHVNFAARIQSKAGPGEILISRTLRDVVRPSGRFTISNARRVTLKGLSGRHPVFAVVWSNGGL